MDEGAHQVGMEHKTSGTELRRSGFLARISRKKSRPEPAHETPDEIFERVGGILAAYQENRREFL